MASSLVAGATFGVVELVGAMVLGQSPLFIVESTASLVMRETAYLPEYVALSIPLGIAVHFSLATLYGYAFGLMSTEARLSTRLNGGRAAVLGAVYGSLLYLFNFQFVARQIYPWLMATSHVAQWLAHALAFGGVLGLLFVRRERRRVARSPRS